jgi:RNA polymerase sigma-70 factor (ECF subfamily)
MPELAPPAPVAADLADFPALWAQVRPTVLGYLVTATGDFHDADDLSQRVAIALSGKFDAYDPARPFGAFAIGMAKMEVLRWRRESARDRLRFSEDAIERLTDAFVAVEPETDARLELLPACLAVLQGKAKEALLLTYRDDLTGEAAAKKIGTSTSNLFSMLSRARAQVRRCVEEKMKK